MGFSEVLVVVELEEWALEFGLRVTGDLSCRCMFLSLFS